MYNYWYNLFGMLLNFHCKLWKVVNWSSIYQFQIQTLDGRIRDTRWMKLCLFNFNFDQKAVLLIKRQFNIVGRCECSIIILLSIFVEKQTQSYSFIVPKYFWYTKNITKINSFIEKQSHSRKPSHYMYFRTSLWSVTGSVKSYFDFKKSLVKASSVNIDRFVC